MAEWMESTLGEIATKDGYGLVDGPFGSNLPSSSYTPSGVPVIRGANLSKSGARFNDSDFVFVSEETANKLERSTCVANDIIFTKKGTLGQTGLIPQDHQFKRFLLSSNQMKLTVNPDMADYLFVYYVVSSSASIEKIIRDASVTGVPKTNVTYLRTFPILLPTLPIQRKIAAILSAYDDLIENNIRRIQLLEETAQSIYREWFVAFRFPGHEAVEMVESELGLIPEGWEVSIIGDITDNHDKRRIPLSSKERSGRQGVYPYYGASGVIDYIDDYIFDGRYLLVAEDGENLNSRKKPVAFFASGKFWVNNHAHIVQGKLPVTNEFLYLFFSNEDISGYITGTAQPQRHSSIACK